MVAGGMTINKNSKHNTGCIKKLSATFKAFQYHENNNNMDKKKQNNGIIHMSIISCIIISPKK